MKTKNVMKLVHPGEPGDGDPERPAWGERGHRAEACTVVWDDTATLAESAIELGASPSGDGSGSQDRQMRDGPAVGGNGSGV